MMVFINLYLIPALALGSIYALGAVGISMIYGILRFSHFAHGDVMTIGAYGTLSAVWAFHLHPLLALPFGIALAVAVALLADRAFYRPLRRLPTIYSVIASFGVALMIRSLVQFVWGPQNQVFQEGVRTPLVLFDSLRISPLHLQAIAITLVLALALQWFLTRTRTGRSMRAVSDDPDLASIAGLEPERVIRWTWIIGAALAATAGVLAGMDTQVHAAMGWNLLLAMFASALLGGIGKPMGAVAGGFIIGMVEELSTYAWIGSESLVSPSYKSALAFVIMVLVLLFRPQGIMRGRLL
jgi:branched-chain amino acid transport system permease protein